MKILVACEFSGIVRDAFIAKGHDAISCDLLPTELPGPHVQGDVLEILDDGWDMMIAFPPCTYLSQAGVVHLKDNPDRYDRMLLAVYFFNTLLGADIEKICVENPVMVSPARELLVAQPADMICPQHFGHEERKRTYLWLKNLPPLLSTATNSKSSSDWFMAIPGWKGRWKERSVTRPGVANAMADQWG